MPICIPQFMPQKGWSLDGSGYPIWTSRAVNTTYKRGARLHRMVFEELAGKPLEPGIEVHHQNDVKTCACPHNLIAMPGAFNPSGAKRCPFTGRFMGREEYFAEFGPPRPAIVIEYEELECAVTAR